MVKVMESIEANVEFIDQTLSCQNKMLGNYPVVNRKWFSLGQQQTNILKTQSLEPVFMGSNPTNYNVDVCITIKICITT